MGAVKGRLARLAASRGGRRTNHRQARRLSSLEKEMGVVRADLERISHELRSIEQRWARAEAAAEPVSGDADEVAEATNVLAAVRAEHERVRVRLQVVSRYEERIRRIEEAVVELYGGDLRGPRPDGR